jgi:pimeloyl-ACP methyl ester carboxylesterase
LRTPLVCLHGFLDTRATWDRVLPRLAAHHDVLVPALPGHAGGPPLPPGPVSADTVVDELERTLDGAGIATAHLVGTSLGGYAALRLAARGRARTVVAFAPAGGWAAGDEGWRETLDHQQRLLEAGLVTCPGGLAMLEGARRGGWPLDPEQISCPVRIVWGTDDELAPWPRAAERYRRDWLPHADWVELDDVGHDPQLEVPLEAAELVLGWTG